MLAGGGPVFSVGGRSYDRGDICVAAVLRGEWTALQEALRRGLACVRRAGEEGAPEMDLEAAAQEFRYARSLITAQETEAWLEHAGLTFEDWSDHLERSLLSKAWSREIGDIASRHPIPDEEVNEHLYAEAVCSGALERFADTLAGRAAVFARVAVGPADGRELERSRLSEAALEVARTFGPSGESLSTEWTARIAAMSRVEAAFQALAQDAVSPSSLRAQIDLHRMDWIRIDWRHISLTQEQAAKEAALCLRHDGESLDAVAASAGIPVRQGAVFVDEIDPAVRAAVLGARPGDLLGPVATGHGFLLALIEGKKIPSEDDAEVRRRAQEELTTAMVAEAKKQVRWHARF